MMAITRTSIHFVTLLLDSITEVINSLPTNGNICLMVHGLP